MPLSISSRSCSSVRLTIQAWTRSDARSRGPLKIASTIAGRCSITRPGDEERHAQAVAGEQVEDARHPHLPAVGALAHHDGALGVLRIAGGPHGLGVDVEGEQTGKPLGESGMTDLRDERLEGHRARARALALEVGGQGQHTTVGVPGPDDLQPDGQPVGATAARQRDAGVAREVERPEIRIPGAADRAAGSPADRDRLVRVVVDGERAAGTESGDSRKSKRRKSACTRR